MKCLDDPSVSNEARGHAEALVRGVDAEYGFFRGHGDQLTVEVWQDVIAICSQEVTALGRLEYLRPLQLAGMHAEMTFVAQAIRAHMPEVNNMTDDCTLSKLKARIGKDGVLHNEKSKIVSNDASYEQHKQFYEGVGRMFGQNMFANYDQLHPQKLDAVKTKSDALKYVREIWSEFGVTDNLFYNPSTEVNISPKNQYFFTDPKNGHARECRSPWFLASNISA